MFGSVVSFVWYFELTVVSEVEWGNRKIYFLNRLLFVAIVTGPSQIFSPNLFEVSKVIPRGIHHGFVNSCRLFNSLNTFCCSQIMWVIQNLVIIEINAKIGKKFIILSTFIQHTFITVIQASYLIWIQEATKNWRIKFVLLFTYIWIRVPLKYLVGEHSFTDRMLNDLVFFKIALRILIVFIKAFGKIHDLFRVILSGPDYSHYIGPYKW